MLFTRRPKRYQKSSTGYIKFVEKIYSSHPKLRKGSCSVIPDTVLFLPEEDISDSSAFLLTEGTWTLGIISPCSKKFFTIIIFLFASKHLVILFLNKYVGRCGKLVAVGKLLQLIAL
jgi:hypothetical protein